MAQVADAPKKKGRNWLWIIGGLQAVCVVCTVISQFWANSPAGQSAMATNTAEAIAEANAEATEAARPTNTPEPTNTPLPPTETAIPESTQDPQELAYADFFLDAMGKLNEAMTEFGELNTRAGDDPTLFLDERWILSTAAQTIVIEEESQRLIDYPLVDVPPRFASAHTKFVEAATLLRDSMPIYRSGVDSRNPDLIREATGMGQEANELINEGTALLPQAQ